MRAVLCMILLSLATPYAHAESGTSATIKQVWGEMKMNEDQRKQVDVIEKKYDPILKTQREKVKQAKQDLKDTKRSPNATPAEITQKNNALSKQETQLENLRIRKQGEIDNILTPEQKQKKAEKKEKRQKRRAKRKEAINNIFSND